MRVLFYVTILLLVFVYEVRSGAFIYSVFSDVMEPGSPFYRRNSSYAYADPVNFPNNFFTMYSAPDGTLVVFQLFAETITGIPDSPNVTIWNETAGGNHIYKPNTNLYTTAGVYMKGKVSFAVTNVNFAIGVVILWANSEPNSPTEQIAADFDWIYFNEPLLSNVTAFPDDGENTQVTSIAVAHPDAQAIVAAAIYHTLQGVFRIILIDVDGTVTLPNTLDQVGVVISPPNIFTTRPALAPYPEGGSQTYILSYGYQISKFGWGIVVQLIDDSVAVNNVTEIIIPSSSLPVEVELSYMGNDTVAVTYQVVNVTHASIRQELINVASAQTISKTELVAMQDTSTTFVFTTNVMPSGKLISTWAVNTNNDIFNGVIVDYTNTSNPPVSFSLPAADVTVPVSRLIVTPLSSFMFAVTQVRAGNSSTSSSFSNYYIVSSCDDGITTPNENCVQGNQGCVNCMCSNKDGYYASGDDKTCKTICGDNIVAGREGCDNTQDTHCVDCACTQGLMWSTTDLLCTVASSNNGPTSANTSTPSSDQSIVPPTPSGWSNDYIAAIVLCPAAAGAAIFLAVFLSKKRKQKRKSEPTKSVVSNPLGDSDQLATYGSIPTPETELQLTSSRTTTENSSTGLRASQIVDRLNVPYSELKFLTEIGAGAYGKVFIGEWQRVKVALKINTAATGADFEREAKLMVELRPHPNVVQMLGVSSDGPYPVMILEFCDGGSLDRKLFDMNNEWTVADQLRTVTGIAKGLYHLHKNQIIHRDISARNILLNYNTPKISDFGLSRSVTDGTKGSTTKSNVGPIRWMAPEALKSMTYSTKSDVWTFGIVVYEIVARKEPHEDADQMMIGVQIRDQAVTPEIPSECDPCLKEIMQRCWQVDPSQRPTMEEICDILDKHLEN